MDTGNGNNEKRDETPDERPPDDEEPKDDAKDDEPQLTVPLSPEVQAQFRAMSEALARQMLPIQQILKGIAFVQQAPLREAMRALGAAQTAKLTESVQAIGRIYSAPLADAVKSLSFTQDRALAESIKSLGTFRLAPRISETLGKHFALQFPKIDFGGYRKVLESTAFFDAKKLLGSFNVTLPHFDPAVFEGIATRARIDLDDGTTWIEADEAAEPGARIEAALEEVVQAVKDLKDEVRSGGKLQILLFLLGTLVAVLLSLADSKFEKPVIVQPVIVIEDKAPDLPAAPPTAPPGAPSPSPSSSVSSSPEDRPTERGKAAP